MNRFVLNVGSMLQGGNFIIRRKALESIGGYDLAITFYGEDTDIARRLHQVGPVKFTFNLPMYSSGRRLSHEGFWTIGIRYALNYAWIIFLKKPRDNSFIDIRTVSAQPMQTTLPKLNRRMRTLRIAGSVSLGVALAMASFYGTGTSAKDIHVVRSAIRQIQGQADVSSSWMAKLYH